MKMLCIMHKSAMSASIAPWLGGLAERFEGVAGLLVVFINRGTSKKVGERV